MLLIISGIVSGVIWFFIFKEARFRAKCKYICNSNAKMPIIYAEVISIKRLNGFVVVNDICNKRLMNYSLYTHTYSKFPNNRYVEKLCKKMTIRWVNYTYKKLKLEEKLSKSKE